jgi:hypothetical protein
MVAMRRRPEDIDVLLDQIELAGEAMEGNASLTHLRAYQAIRRGDVVNYQWNDWLDKAHSDLVSDLHGHIMDKYGLDLGFTFVGSGAMRTVLPAEWARAGVLDASYAIGASGRYDRRMSIPEQIARARVVLRALRDINRIAVQWKRRLPASWDRYRMGL